jgi:hypothetical protein
MDYMYVDYEVDFGLKSLTGAEIFSLNQRLQQDPVLAHQYLANKQGFDNLAILPSFDEYFCL